MKNLNSSFNSYSVLFVQIKNRRNIPEIHNTREVPCVGSIYYDSIYNNLLLNMYNGIHEICFELRNLKDKSTKDQFENVLKYF